jgi:hypothetical protein
MAHKVRPLEMDLQGKRVKVYKNLHNGLWSVLYKGKVVAHLKEVLLDTVVFHVCEKMRQKVIEQQQKKVHAYAIGRYNNSPLAQAEHATLSRELLDERVSYNPYKCGYFVTVPDGRMVYGATMARLDHTGVWTYQPDTLK